jgi:hypothetical protein
MLTNNMKTKMGRPKLPKGTANSVLFAIRIAAKEAQKINEAVKKSGMKKPEWARTILLSAAKEQTN